VTVNFVLWPWPSKLTHIRIIWTSVPSGCQGSFSSKIIVPPHRHTQTDTHTSPVALLGPLKRLEKSLVTQRTSRWWICMQFVRRVPTGAEVRTPAVESVAHVAEVLGGKRSSADGEKGRTSPVIIRVGSYVCLSVSFFLFSPFIFRQRSVRWCMQNYLEGSQPSPFWNSHVV